MLIYNVKASTLKLFGIIAVAVLAMVAMVFLIPDGHVRTTAAIAAKTEKIRYDKGKTNEDRIDFLAQFGWTVDETPIEEIKVTLPGEFDKVMKAYNEIQKQQGLDLEKYKNKETMRYTYKITNYPGYNGTVYANLIVYRNRVIGGDICTSDVKGFLHTFDMPDTEK